MLFRASASTTLIFTKSLPLVTAAVVALLSVSAWPARGETPPTREAARVIRIDDAGRLGRAPVITAVAVSPDAKLLAAGGDDHLIRLWNLDDGKLLGVLKGHVDWVRAVAFSPDGKTLFSAGDDKQIRRWDVASRQPLSVLASLASAVYALAVSDDGRLLAAVGFDDRLRLYDAHEARLLWDVEGPGRDLRAVVFAPGGRQLAAGGRLGKIRVFNAADGALVHQIEAHRQRIRGLAWSDDGARLASVAEDCMARLWDAKSGAAVCELSCRPAKVMAVLFVGPDVLATAGSDNLVCLWDLTTRRPRMVLVGHTGSVAAIARDHDASLLVSGSYDTTARVWLLGRAATADRGAASGEKATRRPTGDATIR